jgi:hypothetical protein
VALDDTESGSVSGHGALEFPKVRKGIAGIGLSTRNSGFNPRSLVHRAMKGAGPLVVGTGDARLPERLILAASSTVA